MRVAVVGHVEWVEFVTVAHVPVAGEIVYAAPKLAVPAGGGGVAAVQLARWSGECALYAAFGDDELGHRAVAGLRERGVEVHAAWRPAPMRRAVTLIDAQRERTIVVIGERHVPHAGDALPWAALADCEAVYLTGGDRGAFVHARQARVLVSTSRILDKLRDAGVALDALVGSAADPGERYAAGDLVPEPALVVRTEGARGGSYALHGETHRYEAVAAEVRGDSYGAGDSFAGALTLALGQRLPAREAIAAAAKLAAEVVGYDGPYPP
jgi:ribokinase